MSGTTSASMNKKSTLTSRTLEKLGINPLRFRSGSQPDVGKDEEPRTSSDNLTASTSRSGRESAGAKHQTTTEKQRKKAIGIKEKLLGMKHNTEDGVNTSTEKSVFYIDHRRSMVQVEDEDDKQVNSDTMQEKKKKFHPEGTIEYIVKDRETIESIAAHFDTTPSELKKINRLTSWMIFAEQVLYIPDKRGKPVPTSTDAGETTTEYPSPFGSPKDKPTMAVPISKLADKPPAVVPGHPERQTPVSSPTDHGLTLPEPLPKQLSEDDVQQLDQDCMERFIKLKVKHITDGQNLDVSKGVVKGTLLVTPNAVMFDPDVSDPLVIEHGCDRYGMIAPMDLIISAAMYHDIAAMKLRGQKHDNEAVQPKPEVYHDKLCPLYKARHPDPSDVPDADDDDITPLNFGVKQQLKHQESVCSCGLGAEMEALDLQTSVDTVDESVFLSVAEEPKSISSKVEISSNDSVGKIPMSCDKNKDVSDDSVTDKTTPENRHEHVRKVAPKHGVTFDLPDAQGSTSDKPSPSKVKAKSDGDAMKAEGEPEGEKKDISALDIELDDSVSDKENGNVTIVTEGHVGISDDQTRIGSIVYLPVKDDTSGKVSLDSLEESQNTLSKMSTVEFEKASKSDTNLSESVPPSEYQETSKVRSASTSSLGPFSPSPHLSAFVNYATGFFQMNASDSCIKDIKDLIPDVKPVTKTERSSTDVPVVAAYMPIPGKRRGKLSRHANSGVQEKVEVESAVSLDEKSELFSMDYDRFMIRRSTSNPNPPLYLCLKLGTLLKKNIFHNYSIESYGKRRKKSEYWFSIPRDKVDHLYAFFVQWTPEIYGDEEEVDPEKRGFIVVPESDHDDDDDFDIMDEHFGPNSAFQKDWEIISKEEAFKRQSIVFEEPIPLPELIGESTILREEHIFQMSQILPARTVGYPWSLIYSTDQHGFSLATLYRDMKGLDSPILLIVKDTADNVFGALTSCELKVSDHFYGTGETFLYTFYPEFQVFHWSGENYFFMKGHKDSLSIGASQGVFGLWFDGDLYHGRTHACETFNNDILTISEDFIVKALEAWAFTDDY